MVTSRPTLVSYDRSKNVARITLVDGDRGNSIQAGMVDQFRESVRQALADDVRVVVLKATGRFFSVGGNLRAFRTAPSVGRYLEALAEELHAAIAELMRADAIVISVVQGHAAGAGFPLAAAADIVLAAESATFQLGYTRVGLSVDGGTSLLVHTLGLHTALRLALLNDTMTANEALAAGLVARVIPDDDLHDQAEKIIAALARGPSCAMAATKRLIRAVAESAPDAAMSAETVSIRSRASDSDGREGVAAFLEKRRPAFK